MPRARQISRFVVGRRVRVIRVQVACVNRCGAAMGDSRGSLAHGDGHVGRLRPPKVINCTYAMYDYYSR